MFVEHRVDWQNLCRGKLLKAPGNASEPPGHMFQKRSGLSFFDIPLQNVRIRKLKKPFKASSDSAS